MTINNEDFVTARCAQHDSSARDAPADCRVIPLRASTDVAGLPGILPAEGRAWPRRSGELISDAVKQQEVFDGLCALQAAGIGFDPLSHEPLGPVQLQDDGTLLVDPSIGHRRLLVQLVGYHAAYCCMWEPGSGLVLGSLRRHADRLQRRSGVSARVKVTFRVEERAPERVATVVNVSSSGLGFTMSEACGELLCGQRLHDCIVTWKGGPELRLDAQVARRTLCGHSMNVGVRLLAPPRDWQELVEELQFSDTVRGSVDAEQAWAAYVASGYLNISGKSAGSFQRARPAFRHAQALLARSPDVGAIFAGGRREEPEAYIHHLQAWPGSWINVHLCRLPTGRTLRTSDDGILLRLYEHCYGFAMARADAQWLVTYTHSQDTAYSHRLHCDFARGLGRSAGCVVPFEPIEVVGVGGTPGEGVGISDATPDELLLLRDKLKQQLPQLYREAMALTSGDVGVRAMAAAWAGSGLHRSRTVLAARRNGRLVAAGVLDFASSGMHVYGLLDKVRLVDVEDATRDDFERLLGAAHRRYLARGTKQFIYFREPAAPYLRDHVAHTSLGHANINVISREQFGSFLEHVFLLHVRTVNHTRADGRSYSVMPPRASMMRSLVAKARTDGLSETRA